MTKPTLNPGSGFSRLRIDLTYDGTNFSGWAKQPNQRTIQQELELALSTYLRCPRYRDWETCFPSHDSIICFLVTILS